MKIKQEKQLTLPQLIEWAWDNGIENKEYPCVGFENKTVIFNSIGWAEFSDVYSYNLTDLFTITIEEEITEDTVFEILLEIRKSKDIYTYSFESTNKIAGSSTKELHAYIDGEFKLIWTHEKGLVG